jgi:hypothetical protein
MFRLASDFGGAKDSCHITEAETGDAGSFRMNFAAEYALGLEAAEPGDRVVKNSAGVGAGAIDGSLAPLGGFVIEGREGRLGEGAAAKAPEGAEDFRRQVLFQQGGGRELGMERFL